MDEDRNKQLVYQGAEAFEQYLCDLDARAPLETANHIQEKLEHKHVPAVHEQLSSMTTGSMTWAVS